MKDLKVVFRGDNMSNKQVRIFKNAVGEILYFYPDQNKWVNISRDNQKNVNRNNIVFVLGIYNSFSDCFAGCLEELGVWMGRETDNGKDKWIMEYCNHIQSFPTLYPSFPKKEEKKNGKCGGCGKNSSGNMDLASWIRLQLHLTRQQNTPVGFGFPSLCSWEEELTKVEKINNIQFKIVNMCCPLEESVALAIDRTRKQPEWGGSHMIEIPEKERCHKVELLQRHLYRKKNEFLKDRENFEIQSWRLFQYPKIVISEVVDWLSNNFSYYPTQEQISTTVEYVKNYQGE